VIADVVFFTGWMLFVPPNHANYCVPVSTVPGRQHLRSASRRQLIVPRVRRSIFGARAFAIAGPTVWNSLRLCLTVCVIQLLGLISFNVT